MATANILLCLEHDEAQALYDLLGRVGGPAKTTRRKHADTMMRALESAGLSDSDKTDIDDGRIYFKPND